MNKITLWLLLLFGCVQMNAQQLWEIESCSVLDSSIYGPMYSVATANATNRMAVIYPAAQLTGIAGQTLNSMYFEKDGTAAMLGTPNFKIYLKEIVASEWPAGALDWATATTDAILVYDSNPTVSVGSSAGWKSFAFSTNFIYSGLQNLAVFYEYTNPVASAAVTWSYEYGSPCISTSNSNTTRYSNNTSGTLPTSLVTTNYRRPLIGFDYVVSCSKPTNLVVSNITSSSVNLAWTAGGTETQWEYGVSPAGSGIPTTTTTVDSNSIIDIPLNSGTTYTLYVKAICGTDDSSVWATTENFTTPCVDAVTIFENFDTSATGSTAPMPNCWSKLGNGTCYVNTGGTAPGSAPNRLYMIGNATASTPTVANAILPAVTNLQADSHRLKFKAYATTANKFVEVGYLTDVLDATTFVVLQTISLPSTTAATAEEFIVVPTGIPIGVENLVLRNSGIGGSTTIYIDDVIWEVNPTCQDISNVVFSAVEDTQVTLSWTAGGTETAWQYAYGDDTVTDPTTLTPEDVTGTSPSQNISGLTPFTAYKIWIRSNCGTSGFGAWIGPYSIKTLCAPVSVFSENFDTSATGTTVPLSDCFSKIGNGTASINTGGVYPGSAPNRLYMFANAGATTPTEIRVFLPAVNNLHANTHRLKFKAYASTANKSFEVGYQSNVLDATTFVLLETINLPSTTAADALEFTVIPSGVPVGVENLVFRNPGEGSVALYIDDVLWEAIPTCPDVTNLVYSSVDDTQITLNWTAGGTETAWQYAYGESTVMDPSTLTPVDVTGTTPSQSIPDLSASTAYKIWIRSNCTTDGFGAWIGPLAVTTLCPPVAAFTENFDTSATGSANPMTLCWDRAGNGATYITTGAVAPLSAPNRIYMSASSTTPTQSYVIMPPVTNLQAETHRLRFKAHASTIDKTLEIGYLDSPTDLNTFTLIESVASLPSTAATSQEYVIVPTAIPVGVNRLVFRNAPTTLTAIIYVDDVIWEVIPSCPDISDLTAGNVWSTSVGISWLPGESETAWQYVYGATTVVDPNTLTPVDVVDTPETTIPDLTPDTSYKVWVRSNCGEGLLGAWSDPITISTTCSPVTDFSENFDTSATGSAAAMPICWTKFGTTGNVYPQTGSVLPATAPNRLYMNTSATTKAFAVLPPVSNLQAETHRLKFKAYATALNKTFEIGYFENSGDVETFVSLESFTPTTTTAATTADFIVVPTGIPTGVESLVLRILGTVSGATTLYADDFVWEPIPFCADVSELGLANLTNISTDLQWTPGDSETAWQYVYGVDTVTDPTTLTPEDATDSPTASISGLTGNTSYKYWVRSNCGNGNFGNWSQPFAFVTPCDAVEIFSENFDAYATGSANPLPDCWRRAGSAATYITTASALPATPPNRLYMTATGSGANPTQGFAIMPPVSNLSDGTHRLRFKAYASTLNKYLEIGFFGDVADITTFILVETIDLPGTTAATAQEFIITPDIPAGITSLVFRNGGTPSGVATLYIDDVVWEAIPTDAPLCVTSTVTPDATCGNFASVITWSPAVGTAEGYNLTIGTTTGGSDVLNNQSIGNVTTYSFLGNANTTYYYTLTPFNVSGVATDCVEQSFTTIATGCYCTSTPTTNSSLGITHVQLGTTNFPTADVTYFDHTATTVDLAQGVLANTKVSFGTTVSYGINIWIDFNNNYNFESTELVFQGESLSTTATLFDASFTMPVNAALGVHRMRIGTADSGQLVPNPCYSGASGVTLDFNVNITPAPSCLPPLTPSIGSFGTTTATLNWNASGSAPSNGYEYYTHIINTPPTIATVASGSVGAGITTADLIDLASGTTHYVWVRSVCGTEDYSEWTSAVSFTTECVAQDLPYSQDFETAIVPNFPVCTTGEVIGNSNPWAIANNPGSGFTSKTLRYGYNLNNAANAWFFTKAVNLVAGEEYKLTYRYGTNSTAYAEDLKVIIGTSANSTAMTTEIDNNVGFNNNTPITDVVTFTAAASGAYYFGFNVYSIANQYNVFVDDILIEQVLSDEDFENASFKVYPNPVKDILYLSYMENITSVQVFNMLGQQVIVKSINAAQGQINMSDLATGTYLVKVAADDKIETIKVIKH